MNDEQLLRYSRQILLPQIDVSGQKKLNDARVLVIGVGGLGSPVSLYLAAAGVGQLVLVDDDEVELSNLQRQIIHSEKTIGQNKALSAKKAIKKINSDVCVTIFKRRLDNKNLAMQIGESDVVVDCTDNFSSRKQINALCVEMKKPLVSGAAIRMEGQLSVFDMREPTNPCYECLYQVESDEHLSCSENGVLSAIVGIVGTSQALEVIKIICHTGNILAGELALFDGLTSRWRYLKLNKDPQCSVCSTEK